MRREEPIYYTLIGKTITYSIRIGKTKAESTANKPNRSDSTGVHRVQR